MDLNSLNQLSSATFSITNPAFFQATVPMLLYLNDTSREQYIGCLSTFHDAPNYYNYYGYMAYDYKT